MALREIHAHGLFSAPNEACGLLLSEPYLSEEGPTQVVQLPNRSKTPRNSYTILPQDIEVAMEGLPDQQVAVWHTHPGGLIGPSEGDMDHRPDPEIVPMLVVALTEHGPVPTWF